MSSWVGHPERELIESWGVPTSTYALADGSKVIVYEYKRDGVQGIGSAWKDSRGMVHYTDPSTNGGYTARRQFTIDAHHVVTQWSWKGE